MRLFCLPYAGGSAAVYRSWAARLGPRFDLVTVELPGHGRRIREPPHSAATTLVELLIAELGEAFRAGPFAIFGHSLGGLLGFQLTHELLRRGLPRPSRLFLSATRRPKRPGPYMLHSLPDAALLETLGRLGGAPQEALAHKELMEIMLPVVRADLQVAETWSFEPPGTLEIPVSLLGGTSDPLVPPAEMDGWRAYFSGEVDRHSYPGDHFYLQPQREALLDHLIAAMSSALDAPGQPGQHPVHI
jgi:surfactin synthase thioesterase subunit